MPEDTFDAVFRREFRWPRTGDQPFATSSDWQDNAHLDQHSRSRLVIMMSGYKKAADIMVLHAVQNRADRDFLAYAIVFNYRQFVELSLKYLISAYGHTFGIDAIWTTHDLSILWRRLSEVLTAYGHDTTEEGDTAAAEIIAEFAKVDPDSFSYRYPVDRRGIAISLAHEALDLSQLADVMNGLDSYFTGCDGYLDSLQSAGP